MEDKLMKILKWAGIFALISLPILFLAWKKHSAEQAEPRVDENDIFAEELTA